MKTAKAPITIKDINQRIAKIKEATAIGDDERAHANEDQLREDVLEHIARELLSQPPIPYLTLGKMAKKALDTRRIKFGRACS